MSAGKQIPSNHPESLRCFLSIQQRLFNCNIYIKPSGETVQYVR